MDDARVRKEEIRTFFASLFQDEVGPNANLVIWGKGAGSHWCETIEEAAAASAKAAAASDIYFGCCLQDPELVREQLRSKGKGSDLSYYRGHAATTAVAPGIWLDVDVANGVHEKQGLPPAVNGAMDCLCDSFEDLEPSLVIMTGGGFHAWWLYEDPWVFGDNDQRGEMASLVRGFQARVRSIFAGQGWTLDATHDLTRVLRAPGTINHKYSGTVLALQDPVYAPHPLDAPMRYSVDALRNWASAGGEIHQVEIQAPTELPDVALSADAQPPVEKFAALIGLHPQFAATWRRDRKDLPSQSEHDLALASMAAKASWGKEEIVSLLIAHRRSGGETLKLDRPDYYARTVAKASAGNEATDAYERLSDRIDAVGAGDTTIAEERSGIYRDLSAMIGIRIERIVRFVADPPQFRLVMAEGSIDLGGAETILSAHKLRAKIAGVSKILIDRFKGDRWDPIAQAILKASEDEDLGADSSASGLVREWLAEYFRQNRPMEDRGQAIDLRAPFTAQDGAVLIFLSGLQQWLAFYCSERFSRKQLGIMLRSAGCDPRTVGYSTAEGSNTSTYCWAIPGDLAGPALSTWDFFEGPPKNAAFTKTTISDASSQGALTYDDGPN